MIDRRIGRAEEHTAVVGGHLEPLEGPGDLRLEAGEPDLVAEDFKEVENLYVPQAVRFEKKKPERRAARRPI